MSDKDKAVAIRKSKIQEQLIEQLRITPVVEISCKRVGIGRNSYYRWRRQSKKFAEVCDQALQEGCELINDLAQSTIISAMKDGNLTASMYWLNHRSQAFGNKLEVKGTIAVNDGKLTKEQEDNIMRALELSSLITKEGEQNEKRIN